MKSWKVPNLLLVYDKGWSRHVDKGGVFTRNYELHIGQSNCLSALPSVVLFD